MAKKAKTAGAPRAATATDIAKRITHNAEVATGGAGEIQHVSHEEVVKLAKKYLALKSK